MMIKLVLIYTLVCLFGSKHIKQLQRINRFKKWHYVTKFGAEVGNSRYELQLSLLLANISVKSVTLNFQLYLDDKWEEVLRTPECERYKLAEINDQVRISTDGEVLIFKGELNQVMRRHMWFFVLEDCNSKFVTAFPKHVNMARMLIDLHIINSDGSEFTTEDNGIGSILVVLSLINFLFLMKTLSEIQREYKNHESWDLSLLFLFSAMGIEALHHVCNLVHTYIYASDGMGIIELQTIGDILEITSAFLVTLILIMVASGWSINFESILKFDMLIPLSMIVGLCQMMIIGLSKISDDHYTKFHKYEGWTGYTITMLYFGQYAYFIYNIMASRMQGNNIRRFMLQLGIYGSFFLLSFPTFFIISHFLAPYVRQKVIVYGTQFIRLFATAMLLQMFTSKNSTYHQISYKNKSFLDRSKED